MSLPSIEFKVVEEQNCPKYSFGTTFAISGALVVTTPEASTNAIVTANIAFGTAKSCRILTGDFCKIICKYSRSERIPEYAFQCSGCTGRITVEKVSADAFDALVESFEKSQAELLRFRQLPIFRRLATVDVEHVLPRFWKRETTPAQIILEPGEVSNRFFIVSKGEFEVVSDATLLFVLRQGDIFGESSILCNTPVTVSVRSRGNAELLCTTRETFQKLLSRYPELHHFVTENLAARLSQSSVAKVDADSDFSGSLAEIPIEALLQLIHTNQKTGTLRFIRLDLGEAEIAFRTGEVIAASYSVYTDIDAFLRLFSNRSGMFAFQTTLSPLVEKKTQPIGAFMKLLMTGLQRSDERLTKV